MSKGKKVIILNHGLHISGVSKTLVSFANALAKNGYDVDLKIEINDFTLKKELDEKINTSLFIKEPYILGHRVRGFLRIYDGLVKLIYKLPPSWQYKIFVREKYDVEIAFNRGAAAKIISGSTNKKARTLVWVHSDYMKTANALAGFKDVEDAQRGYRNFDNIICVSEQAKKAFIEKFGKDFNLVTRYNIMDIGHIISCAEAERHKKEKFTIVTVGRMCDAKNYLMLLESVRLLVDKGYSFELWMIGDGELRGAIEEKIAALHLTNVILYGMQINPYSYLAQADLYVSSSIYEGLSTTTIEALILGKPVVVTDCTGMRDILGDSEYGLVVPIDVNELAYGIEKMMTDKAFFDKYTEKSKLRGLEFDPIKAFSEIEKLF